jgi:hypothetical protein
MDALHAYTSSSSDDDEDQVMQKMPSSSSAAPVLPPPRTAPNKNDQVGGSMLLWSKRYDTNAVLPSTSAAAVVGAVVGKPAERHWVMPGPPVEEWETVDRLMKLELAARMGPPAKP